MNFPYFASAIILFSIVLAIAIKISNKKTQKEKQKYYDREAMANDTRAKSLDDLQYIVIPDEILNIFFSNFNQNSNFDENATKKCEDWAHSMEHLSNAKIVNLNNISNTDLKLTYGAPNLPLLTEYDQNYSTLSRILIEAGELYYKYENFDVAGHLYEYSISIGCDSMIVYKTLAQIYKKEDNLSGIDYLLSSASLLDGITKEPIIKYLSGLSTPDKGLEESILDILD